MPLWDALSGKVWHWNSSRLEVHHAIYPRLKNYPPELHEARDFLFAAYYAFFDCFGKLMFSDDPRIRARNHIARLKSIDKRGLMTLASRYACDSVVRLFANADDCALRGIGPELITLTCSLYDVEKTHEVQLLKAFEQAQVDLSAMHLCMALNGVLGPELDVQPWLQVREQIEAIIFACIEQPDWDDRVTKELSRPPRAGGYADSIMT